MTRTSSATSEQERRLNEVLAEYLEAAELGRAPDRTALLARYPDLAGELKEFFANRDRLGSLADPMRTVDFGQTPPQKVAELPPGTRFGDHEIVEEIARGGMGIVYRARQVSLNRIVALKMILASQATSLNQVRRFWVEAEAAAHLDHPNIVPVYERGNVNGQPYFTMKFIDGGSLAGHIGKYQLCATDPKQRLDRKSLAAHASRLAGLLATVARAVHHAHQRGVLHRDLKPANILLDAAGEPMVTDFGLAKRVDQNNNLTQVQTVIGTAAYMAPEQALAQRTGLTTAVDVYSLGAILYELLTGQPPFVGDSCVDTLAMVIKERPLPPSRRNPKVPGDLEAICMKCLAKEPAQRFGSALDLARDLESWQAGEAISLRPQKTKERIGRWARRNRLAAALLGTVAALVVFVSIGSSIMAWHIDAARQAADNSARQAEENARIAEENKQTAVQNLRDAQASEQRAKDSATKEREASSKLQGALTDAVRAKGIARKESTDAVKAREAAVKQGAEAVKARDIAETALKEKHRLLVSGYVTNGTHALDSGDVLGAISWYAEALHQDAGDAGREELHRVRLGSVLRNCPRVMQIWENNNTPAVISPSGRQVVLIQRDTAHIRDVVSGEALPAALKHDTDIDRAVFNPAGTRIVTTAASGSMRVWDAANGKPITSIFKPDKATTWSWVAFSPDGKRLATVSLDRTARIWDAATGKLLTGPLSHLHPIRFASWSRDGKRLVTCGGDVDAPKDKGEIRIWDLSAAKPTSKAFTRQVGISWAWLTPDGEHLVAAGGKRVAYLITLSSGNRENDVIGVKLEMPDGVVGQDPTRVLKIDGSVAQVWDVRNGKSVGAPMQHNGEVMFGVFSPDGRFIATSAIGQVARVWDAATGKPLTPSLRHGRFVRQAAFSADGQRLLTRSEDGAVRIWEMPAPEMAQAKSLPMITGRTATSPDGSLVASVDKDGAVSVRNAVTVTGKPLHGPWKLTRPVTDVAFDPEGTRVLAASEGGAQIWTVRDKAAPKVLSHSGVVKQAIFTPDGSRVAIVGPNDVLEIFDARTGVKQPGQSKKLPAKVLASRLALSPDGGVVVTAGMALTNIVLKDIATDGRVRTLRHNSVVNDAAFSPDGKRLAVATAEGTAYLWDIATGQTVAASLLHGQPLRQVVFSADGGRLATVAEDHTVRVWDLRTAQPLTPLLPHADAIANASLSKDGSRLAVRCRDGTGHVWNLSPDKRPVDYLVQLTQLLACQAFDSNTGGFRPLTYERFVQVWKELRDKFPKEFGAAKR